MADETVKQPENDKCVECKSDVYVHDIEILGQWYEIGGYCDNKECSRYKLLVV